eukprot:6198471-Pyramimonas_sp.AAC.1
MDPARPPSGRSMAGFRMWFSDQLRTNAGHGHGLVRYSCYEGRPHDEGGHWVGTDIGRDAREV